MNKLMNKLFPIQHVKINYKGQYKLYETNKETNSHFMKRMNTFLQFLKTNNPQKACNNFCLGADNINLFG